MRVTIVYKPRFEDGYEWVMPVGSTDPIRRLPSRQPGDPWTPVWVYPLSPGEDGQPAKKADMPWHGSGVLVLRRPAREVLGKVLADDAEMLSLYCDEGEDLWLVNAWRVVDALDEELSQVERFSSGRIMTVHRYAFREEAVAGLRCFRIPQQHVMFVTDEVAEATRAAGLRGTTFRPVWSSGASAGTVYR